MRLHRRHLWTLGLATALALAGPTLSAPSQPAGATDETFFQDGAPCPIAHCDQQLDGNEGLSIPVSLTPTVTTNYTPPSTAPVAFNIGLGCTTGFPASGGLPSVVECSGTQPSGAGSAAEPFIYNLAASTSGNPVSSVSLTKQWVSAAYTGPQTYPCNGSSPTE